MNNIATLVFDRMTCIDHAKLTVNEDGQHILSGGSYNATVIVTGLIEQEESVVIDFSACKSIIKRTIDDPEVGIDHKLWVMADYHRHQLKVTNLEKTCRVECGNFSCEVDGNSFIIFNGSDLRQVERLLEIRIEEALTAILGNDVISKVVVQLDDLPINNKVGTTHAFRYAHGLKDSSSKACQNIVHGHQSYFQLLDENYLPIESIYNQASNDYSALLAGLEKVRKELDGTYFVYSDNVIELDGNVINIGYNSQSRGQFKLSLDFTVNKVVTLPTETTVEYLSQYVAEYINPLVQEYPEITYIKVSEGLTKGAIVEVQREQ